MSRYKSISQVRCENINTLLREQFGNDRNKLAGVMGVSPAYISNLRNGKSFGDEKAREIEDLCHLPKNWLDHPHGEGSTLENLAAVPLYPLEVSSGGGSFWEGTEPTRYRAFDRDWLVSQGWDPADLALFVVRGHSNEGLVSHGDLVMINRRENQLVVDDLFVLRVGDRVYLKTVQRPAAGVLRLISHDGKNHPPFEVQVDGPDEIEVLGRAVWWAHTNR